MNGIENIIKRIDEDTEKRVSAIIESANAKALEVAAEYAEKCKAVKAEGEARAKKAADEKLTRICGANDLEARKSILAKKQALISDAFVAAAEKLSALPDEKRADTLAGIALRAADGGKGEIILSPSERALIGEKILEKTAENKNITLSEETRDIGSGLILRDGAAEVDCTFRTLVMQLRDNLSREVADVLFG